MALVMMNIFIFGNLKICLMKILVLLRNLIIILLEESEGICLKQDKVTYTHKKIITFTLFMR